MFVSGIPGSSINDHEISGLEISLVIVFTHVWPSDRHFEVTSILSIQENQNSKPNSTTPDSVSGTQNHELRSSFSHFCALNL